MALGNSSVPDFEPLSLGWLADVLDQLESTIAETFPSDEFERTRLLSQLPRLRVAIDDWVLLLQAQASGEDIAASLWSAVGQLTANLPAEPESPWTAKGRAGVLPLVAPESVAGRILHARRSRAMESDPFRDAASALSVTDPAEAASLARNGRSNAERAIRSIDSCLRALTGGTT